MFRKQYKIRKINYRSNPEKKFPFPEKVSSLEEKLALAMKKEREKLPPLDFTKINKNANYSKKKILNTERSKSLFESPLLVSHQKIN